MDSGGTAAFYTRILANPDPASAEELLAPPPVWVEQSLDDLGPHGDRTALDLGYGSGTRALAIAERGFTVIAVDQIPSSLFTERWGDHPFRRRVSTVEARMEGYQADAPYGVVLALDVLHYLPQASVRRLLSQLASAAPPGALHLLRVFVDIHREIGGRSRALENEADFTQAALSGLLRAVYSGWTLDLSMQPHEETSADGGYQFRATAAAAIARRNP